MGYGCVKFLPVTSKPAGSAMYAGLAGFFNAKPADAPNFHADRELS